MPLAVNGRGGGQSVSCQRECYSDPTLGDYSGKTHHSLARSRPIKIGFARPNRVMTPHITSVLPCLLTTAGMPAETYTRVVAPITCALMQTALFCSDVS